MEDPAKAVDKARLDKIAKTSKYNKDEIFLKRTFLIIIIVLTLISIGLGAANIALFFAAIRTFSLPVQPSWLSLTSKDSLFYFWAAAGLYSFLAIIAGVVGLQIKDGKQKVALAYIVMGPIVVVMALGQAGAGIMLFVAHYQGYSNNLANTQFLLSFIDIAVGMCGLIIAIWILVVWVMLFKKRNNPLPDKEDQVEDEESEFYSEDDDELDYDDNYDEGPRRNNVNRPPTIRQIFNPRKPRKNGVFIPMPFHGTDQPRIIVINPKMRRPSQIPTRIPPFRPPYGMRENFNPYPPMRGPLPAPPQMRPYQPFAGRSNMPLAYQSRYYG